MEILDLENEKQNDLFLASLEEEINKLLPEYSNLEPLSEKKPKSDKGI